MEYEKIREIISQIGNSNYKDLAKALISYEYNIEDEKLLDKIYEEFMERDYIKGLLTDEIEVIISDIKDSRKELAALVLNKSAFDKVYDISNSKDKNEKACILIKEEILKDEKYELSIRERRYLTKNDEVFNIYTPKMLSNISSNELKNLLLNSFDKDDVEVIDYKNISIERKEFSREVEDERE